MTYGFSRRALSLANCRRAGLHFVVLVAAILAPTPPVMAATNIANTVHNLTPTGPGTFKAPEATGLCVYCHAPHNASPTRGLWNRALSGVTYQLYTSTTLKAVVNQPDGSSRLCLSCHDGTLAMGTLRNAQNGVQPTLGVLTGITKLGTDLSIDHPVSFVYDSALVAARGELVNPLTLPNAVKLDQNNELQCTSCHDAHEDRHPNFLRMDTRYGALCLTCHQPTSWSGTTHATSLATWNGVGADPWSASAYPTVADNACANCHRPHQAGYGKSLLAQSSEAANCIVCHSGTVAAKNIQKEFLKPSHHPIENFEWTHTPKEDAATMPRHVTCADCHNAHAANASSASLPNVSGPLLGTRGINQGGTAVTPANYEYEVCYKCHGLSSATTAGLTRMDNIRNARLQFDPANPSYHPVAAIGKNTLIQDFTLGSGYTASSLIGCSSCHNNDAWTSGGTNPAGVHGSNYQPILASDYQTNQTEAESPSTYALCYTCHDRNAFLTDVAGKFPHAKHVIQDQEPCAACHDAHGSRQYPYLINFMLFDRNGTPVASNSSSGSLTYTQIGTGGQCSLKCHSANSGADHDHNPSSY